MANRACRSLLLSKDVARSLHRSIVEVANLNVRHFETAFVCSVLGVPKVRVNFKYVTGFGIIIEGFPPEGYMLGQDCETFRTVDELAQAYGIE